MAISDRIHEAISKFDNTDYINALIQISIAIDATGKKVFPGKKTSVRSKKYIRNNIDLISIAAFGIVEFQGALKLKLSNSGKPKSIEDVMYSLVRCSLLHEGDLPSQVEVTTKSIIEVTEEGVFLLSSRLIWGMIISVIACPENINEKSITPYTFTLGDEKYDINQLWGQKQLLLERLRYLNGHIKSA